MGDIDIAEVLLDEHVLTYLISAIQSEPSLSSLLSFLPIDEDIVEMEL